MARRLGRHAILANAVASDIVDTPMLRCGFAAGCLGEAEDAVAVIACLLLPGAVFAPRGISTIAKGA
jgi:3-oxoacyl-[acyl-carrier protein] reductase